MSPEELTKFIIAGIGRLLEQGDPDSVRLLEEIFNLLEDHNIV